MCWTSLAILYGSFIGEPLQEKCADIVIDAQFLSHMQILLYVRFRSKCDIYGSGSQNKHYKRTQARSCGAVSSHKGDQVLEKTDESAL